MLAHKTDATGRTGGPRTFPLTVRCCGMAAWENLLEGNVAVLAAAGAATLLLPIVLPSLATPLRAALTSGLTLFLESEAEAEGGIMGKLAESTVEVLLGSLSGPGNRERRQQAAQLHVRQFEATARQRAQRYAWNDADAAARYRRHVAHFRHALARAQAAEPAARRHMLDHAAQALSEDW